MNAQQILKIGKIVFALPFLLFGLGHLANAGQMAGMVPGWVPGGVLWVYITGLALIAGGAAIIAGKMVKFAALGIAALMVVFILAVHVASMGSNPMWMAGAFKDLGLAGGALIIAALSWDE